MGNSLALRIPMAFARQIGLVKDGLVIDLEGDRIFTRCVARIPPSDALLKVPENMHAPEDFEIPSGAKHGSDDRIPFVPGRGDIV